MLNSRNYQFMIVGLLCCSSPLDAQRPSYNNAGEIRQHARHELLVELSSQRTLSGESVEIETPGEPPRRITHTQPISILMEGDNASLTMRHPSGLRLSTVIRWSDLRLEVPELRATRFSIIDSAGVGIADASISVDGGLGRYAWEVSTRTTIQGAASIWHPRNASGRARLRINAEGYSSYVGDTGFGAEEVVSVTLRATSVVTGSVRRGSTVDRASFQALALDQGRRRVVSMPVSGPFRYEDLPPGRYDFVFVVPRSGTLTIPGVSVQPGTTVDLGEVDLAGAGAVDGIVRDKTKARLPGVRVRLVAPGIESSAMPEAYTDAEGQFHFSGVLPGEYTPELYLPSLGWRTFTDTPVFLPEDRRVERVLDFAPSGCSLRLEFDGSGTRPTSYSIILPVSDGPIQTQITESLEQRLFPSVPCGGTATVTQTDSSPVQYATSLEPGESYIRINLAEPPEWRDLRLTLAGKPVAGATLSVSSADTTRLPVRESGYHVTDENGSAILRVPESDDLTVHIERGGLHAIVEHVNPWLHRGYLQLDLPDRTLRLLAQDAAGQGIAELSVSGHRIQDGSGNHVTGMPSGVITSFSRGRTDSSGTFDIAGLGDGEWKIYVGSRDGGSQATNVTFQPLQSSLTVYVHVREQ